MNNPNPNPNTIHLVVELGPETMGKLDAILTALEKAGHHNCQSCVESAVTMTKDLAEQATAAAAAAPETTEAPAPAADPVPPEKAEQTEQTEYTKDDIVALVQKLAAPNSPTREKAKAIVKEYAPKVSAIPADKYGEVMDRLNKLTA